MTGCVSRRMTIVSNPPGAMALLDGKEIGYTPASADFLWYGTRQVTLIKDGFETKTDMVTVSAPWYQWPVIEFLADNFSPTRVTDRRIFNFNLQPRQMIPDEELRSGKAAAERSTIGAVTPNPLWSRSCAEKGFRATLNASREEGLARFSH